MKVLAVDTTADDTCAAVVEDGQKILSNIVHSQSLLHVRFGGIVPQIASYEHLRNILPVVDEACRQAQIGLDQIDLFATGQAYDRAHTYYLVCLDTAKIFAKVFGKPLVGVDHIEAHILVNFVVHPRLDYPFISLTVAGGHTILVWVRGFADYQILGQTRDDAAGEAFDKVARLLELGYPGGPVIDRAARAGNPQAFKFKSPMKGENNFDFSYSGLKTAVFYEVRDLKEKYGDPLPSEMTNDLAASFRRAAVGALTEKIFRATRELGLKKVVLGGGVAANELLRDLVDRAGREHGVAVFYPPKVLCTDNAVGTAALAFRQFRSRGGDDLLKLSYFRETVLGQ